MPVDKIDNVTFNLLISKFMLSLMVYKNTTAYDSGIILQQI